MRLELSPGCAIGREFFDSFQDPIGTHRVLSGVRLEIRIPPAAPAPAPAPAPARTLTPRVRRELDTRQSHEEGIIPAHWTHASSTCARSTGPTRTEATRHPAGATAAIPSSDAAVRY